MTFKGLILVLSLSILFGVVADNQQVMASDNQQTQTFSRLIAGTLRVTGSTGIQVEGNKIDLDADRDTSITADTDDQVDFEVGGADVFTVTTTAAKVKALDFTETSNTQTGAQTITPTTSVLKTAPGAAVLTMTLGTPTGLKYLLVYNANTTNTVIVDTGATAGGGNVTLGQNDNAQFYWTGTLWMELASPDNS